MASVSPAPLPMPRHSAFARPWLALCVAFAAHVADEALTGFLSVYNPTVVAARHRWPWFPMPTFSFDVWLYGLMAAVLLAFLLTPLAASNRRGLRPFAWFFAVVMFLNGLGHISGTILGRTFPEIRFARPMPGFYSSPLLLFASIWLMVRLRRTV